MIKKIMIICLSLTLVMSSVSYADFQTFDEENLEEYFKDMVNGTSHEACVAPLVEAGILKDYDHMYATEMEYLTVEELIRLLLTAMVAEVRSVEEGEYWSVPYIEKAFELGLIDSIDNFKGRQFSLGLSNEEAADIFIRAMDYTTYELKDTVVEFCEKYMNDFDLISEEYVESFCHSHNVGFFMSDPQYPVKVGEIERIIVNYIYFFVKYNDSESVIDEEYYYNLLYAYYFDTDMKMYDEEDYVEIVDLIDSNDEDEYIDIVDCSDESYIVIGKKDENTDNSVLKTIISKYSYSGELMWQKIIGENADTELTKIIKFNEGEYLLCGEVNEQPYILVIDGEGNVITEKSLIEMGNINFVDVEIDNDGNILFLITSRDSNPEFFNPSAHLYSILFKYNNQFEEIYRKLFDYNDVTYLEDIEVTDENEYIIAGHSSLNLKADCLLIRTNDDGEIISKSEWGYEYLDTYENIILMDNGDYVIIGNSNANEGIFTENSKNQVMIFIQIYDKNGEKKYEDIVQDMYKNPMNLTKTSDGGFIFMVQVEDLQDGDYDTYVVQYDSAYNEIFRVKIDGPGRDRLNELISINNGNFIAVGRRHNDSQNYLHTTLKSNAIVYSIKNVENIDNIEQSQIDSVIDEAINVQNILENEYYEALVEKEIIKNSEDESFNLEMCISKAKLVEYIINSMNANTNDYEGMFIDCLESDWFTPYIESAKKMVLLATKG